MDLYQVLQVMICCHIKAHDHICVMGLSAVMVSAHSPTLSTRALPLVLLFKLSFFKVQPYNLADLFKRRIHVPFAWEFHLSSGLCWFWLWPTGMISQLGVGLVPLLQICLIWTVDWAWLLFQPTPFPHFWAAILNLLGEATTLPEEVTLPSSLAASSLAASWSLAPSTCWSVRKKKKNKNRKNLFLKKIF